MKQEIKRAINEKLLSLGDIGRWYHIHLSARFKISDHMAMHGVFLLCKAISLHWSEITERIREDFPKCDVTIKVVSVNRNLCFLTRDPLESSSSSVRLEVTMNVQ